MLCCCFSDIYLSEIKGCKYSEFSINCVILSPLVEKKNKTNKLSVFLETHFLPLQCKYLKLSRISLRCQCRCRSKLPCPLHLQADNSCLDNEEWNKNLLPDWGKALGQFAPALQPESPLSNFLN